MAIRAFERLSDHQLADIGIPRAQIREVVEGLVGRNGHPRKDTGTTTAEVSAQLAAPPPNSTPCVVGPRG